MIGRRMLSKMTARQVKYVQPVFDPEPGSLSDAVYRQVIQEMKMVVPPVLAHSPAPQVMAAFWTMFRETLNASGVASRRDKEVVAAAVSVANICPYCVDMHTTGMYDLATAADADAVGADRLDEVDDPVTRELAQWARVTHLRDDPLLRMPPFEAAQASEIIGVVVTFQYLNRMVNVFLSNHLLPPRIRGAARRRLKQGVSMAMRPLLRAYTQPGEALALLPEAGPLPDLVWADGNPTVADAMARATATFEAAGAESVPEPVRRLVLAELAAWNGEEKGISRAWCEEAIAVLEPRDQAAGRLALLTAFASYQVDENVVEAFQETQPDDEVLVKATAWVSYATARVIGERVAAAVNPTAEPGLRS